MSPFVVDLTFFALFSNIKLYPSLQKFGTQLKLKDGNSLHSHQRAACDLDFLERVVIGCIAQVSVSVRCVRQDKGNYIVHDHLGQKNRCQQLENHRVTHD